MPPETIQTLPVSRIQPGNNDRHTFDADKLAELASSIQAHGLAQPITVRPIFRFPCGRATAPTTAIQRDQWQTLADHQPPTPDTPAPDGDPACWGHNCVVCARSGEEWPSNVHRGLAGLPRGTRALYQIVAGERRFRAIRDVLREQFVHCVIRWLDDSQASAVMLSENVSREDLDPIDEAQAYDARMREFGWGADYIAKLAGVSADRVRRRVSLLRLHPDIQGLVAKRHMPLSHAEAIGVLDHTRQLIAFRLYRDSQGMTLTTLQRIVSDLLAEQSQDSLFDLETFWQQTIAQLADLPLRGKHAVVPVPTRSDIPQPELRATDTTSQVILRYIHRLADQGYAAEASTVGTLYTALVHSNSLAMPNANGLPD